jgi:hypothetical protein
MLRRRRVSTTSKYGDEALGKSYQQVYKNILAKMKLAPPKQFPVWGENEKCNRDMEFWIV